MAKGKRIVYPNEERGGWDIKKGVRSRAIKHFEKKGDATAYGKEFCAKKGINLVLYKQDGTEQKTIKP
jgi:hypothetical protein